MVLQSIKYSFLSLAPYSTPILERMGYLGLLLDIPSIWSIIAITKSNKSV